MTGETENLMLELLRGPRADIASPPDDIGRLRGDGSAIRERRDGIGMQPRGSRDVSVAIKGSLVTDMKGCKVRTAALEGAPA